MEPDPNSGAGSVRYLNAAKTGQREDKHKADGDMEVEMEVEETESARHERVKELEAMVLQLAKENKKLLTKVTASEGKYREEASSSAARRGGGGGGEKLGNATSTDDLISLDGEVSEANEDEW